MMYPMGGSRGGKRGSGPPPPPLKNHKNIGFPSNIGPDPLNITKLPCLAIMGTPAKRHLNGDPL